MNITLVNADLPSATAVPPLGLVSLAHASASAGHTVPIAKLLDDYYRVRGWDVNGSPTKETLARLGLKGFLPGL